MFSAYVSSSVDVLLLQMCLCIHMARNAPQQQTTTADHNKSLIEYVAFFENTTVIKLV